jgi:hypothetical protein
MSRSMVSAAGVSAFWSLEATADGSTNRRTSDTMSSSESRART